MNPFYYILGIITLKKHKTGGERSGERWNSRILTTYILLQLPALFIIASIMIFLYHWSNLAGWIVWAVIGVWLTKDIVLFPFVWPAFDFKRRRGANEIIGEHGWTVDRLNPSGYVRMRGELWKAELANHSLPVGRNSPIKVINLRGLTLIVEGVQEQTAKQ